jgi:hypothetical protein
MRPCASRCSAPNEPPLEGQRTQVTPPVPTSTIAASLTSASPSPRLRRRRRRRRRPSPSSPPLPNPTILQPPLHYYSPEFLAYCPIGGGRHSFTWVDSLRCWSSPRFYSFPPLLEVPSTPYSLPPPRLTVPRTTPPFFLPPSSSLPIRHPPPTPPDPCSAPSL